MTFSVFHLHRNGLRLLLVTLLACLPWLSHGQTARMQHGLSPTHGNPEAPNLDLQGLDGSRHRLSEHLGKVVIINFWATWCPPCIAEMPTLQDVWDLLHDDNFEVLAVNVGEDEETVRRFADQFEPKLGFPILLTTDPSIMQTWGIQGMPTSHIIDTRGRIAYTEVGAREFSHEHIVSRLRELMAAASTD